MKALYHAWELGYDSWRDFAKALIISDEVTIWGVSHDQIARANREYGFPYTPDQFATLVEEGISKSPRGHDGSPTRRIAKNSEARAWSSPDGSIPSMGAWRD